MVRRRTCGRWGKGDGRRQRRATVDTEEGWVWVWENDAWRVGVSADIGCMSMHWEAWVWARNAIAKATWQMSWDAWGDPGAWGVSWGVPIRRTLVWDMGVLWVGSERGESE